MLEDRIEALERIVLQLAETAAAQVAATAAQAVVARALVDLIGRAGIPMDDVRDLALDIAAGMSGEVDTAVRSLLSEPPAGTGRVQ